MPPGGRKNLGLTMKKCSKCGLEKPLDEFYVKRNQHGNLHPSSWCKSCRQIESREYYKGHAQQQRDSSKRWRGGHRDRARELHDRWMEKHKEEYRPKVNEWSRKSRLKHPNTALRGQIRRVLRIIQSREHFTDEEWQELFRESGSKCWVCGSEKNLTVDHVIPISKGGSDTIDNIRVLCHKHNSSKKDKLQTPTEMIGDAQVGD